MNKNELNQIKSFDCLYVVFKLYKKIILFTYN